MKGKVSLRDGWRPSAGWLAGILVVAGLGAGIGSVWAQVPASPPSGAQAGQGSTAQPADSATPVTPGGTVIFSREQSLDPDAPASPQVPAAAALETDGLGKDDPLKITDAERDALTFTAYDLDVHLTPASAGISVRTGLTVRNDGAVPLGRVVLEISSSLRWDGFSTIQAGRSEPLKFVARRIATDADHTGWAEEAVVTLKEPLAPGASIAMIGLYSGAIPQSAERLERIGAAAGQGAEADWDAIGGNTGSSSSSSSSSSFSGSDIGNVDTALRGFGNVLWYPVAAPPVFLGDEAKLFQAVGRAKLRQAGATVRLRVAVEFVGEAPDAVFFCGQRQQLTAIHDNVDVPVAEAPGIATAVFDARPLGFRVPSLFVTNAPPRPVGIETNGNLMAVVTEHEEALPAYSAAAALVEPLLADWLGPQPLAVLNVIDHPGQPFEDGTLLVRPVRAEEPAALAPSLAHSLTHAWVQSSHPWIDEGLAQFMGLLWIERSEGHGAAINQLEQDTRALALGEPAASGTDSAENSGGQSLVDASSEVYYRTKAAAVWWMLRGIVGDEALKKALQGYRMDAKADHDPAGLEHVLEEASHKDLRWFFENWVYRDRGLPDLTIVNVTPRQIEAHNGLPAGWLVAIVVRNDGDAEAEVPLTVRSAGGAAAAVETQRLRIPGHTSVSRRIVFAGTPDEVQVNDSGVPEVGVSIHTRRLVLPGQ